MGKNHKHDSGSASKGQIEVLVNQCKMKREKAEQLSFVAASTLIDRTFGFNRNRKRKHAPRNKIKPIKNPLPTGIRGYRKDDLDA